MVLVCAQSAALQHRAGAKQDLSLGMFGFPICALLGKLQGSRRSNKCFQHGSTKYEDYVMSCKHVFAVSCFQLRITVLSRETHG